MDTRDYTNYSSNNTTANNGPLQTNAVQHPYAPGQVGQPKQPEQQPPYVPGQLGQVGQPQQQPYTPAQPTQPGQAGQPYAAAQPEQPQQPYMPAQPRQVDYSQATNGQGQTYAVGQSYNPRQAHEPAHPPQDQYLPYAAGYATAGAPAKKKRTVLFVSLGITGILLVAALVVASLALTGFFETDNNLSAGAEKTIDVDPIPTAEPDPEPEPDPKPEPDPDPKPDPDPSPTDLELYANKAMGIEFDLPDDWYTVESKNYPDEVLELHPENETIDSFIWIDRFPGMTVSAYEADTDRYMSLYSFTDDNSNITDLEADSLDIGGQEWRVAGFFTNNGEQDYACTVFYTDMPNNGGLLLVAQLKSADATGSAVDSNDFEELVTIVASLDFVGTAF